jgi:hypothetical protein
MAEHPRDFADLLPDQEQAKFFSEPLKREYFEEWVAWLATLFDATPSHERRAAYFSALTSARFTNAEMGRAGDYIALHNERFPAVAHFVQCPDLGRNHFKS